MTARVLLAAGFLMFTGGVASSQVLELEGRYWRPTLTSSVRILGDNAEVPPDLATIDLKGDLGLQDKSLTDWRLTLFTGPRSRLRAAFVKMDYAADHEMQRTVVFQGQTYTVGTRVLSSLRFDYWRLGWTWQFVGGPYSKVRFGTLLEAKYAKVDTSLGAPNLTPPVLETKKLSGALPSLGVVLDINPARSVNVSAEVSGVSLGDRGHAFDGEAVLKLILPSGIVLDAGYRYLDIEVKDDPDFAKLKNAGPFVGAGVRF